MANPLVSVLMPCYQQESFVREALRSVLRQSYAPMEIVIADDASSDGTVSAIKMELAETRSPHPVAFMQNRRNLGIETYNALMGRARGDFIVHAHGDDVSLPDRVVRLVARWQETGVSLVTSNARDIDAASRPLGMHFPEDCDEDDMAQLIEKCGARRLLGAAFAYERAVFDRFGPFDRRHSPIRTDVVIPFRAMLLNGYSIVNEPLLLFRRHESVAKRYKRAGVDSDLARIEAAMAEVTGQFLYLLDTLAKQAERDPDDARLAPIRAQVKQSLMKRVQKWSAARNRLIAEGWRCDWHRPE